VTRKKTVQVARGDACAAGERHLATAVGLNVRQSANHAC
jgi:hypothetical protein